MTWATARRAIDEITGELLAVDVVAQLPKIASAQHRIRCALASDQRDVVMRHLDSLGITEAAVSQYMDEPLDGQAIADLSKATEQVAEWRNELHVRIRELALTLRKDSK